MEHLLIPGRVPEFQIQPAQLVQLEAPEIRVGRAVLVETRYDLLFVRNGKPQSAANGIGLRLDIPSYAGFATAFVPNRVVEDMERVGRIGTDAAVMKQE